MLSVIAGSLGIHHGCGTCCLTTKHDMPTPRCVPLCWILARRSDVHKVTFPLVCARQVLRCMHRISHIRHQYACGIVTELELAAYMVSVRRWHDSLWTHVNHYCPMKVALQRATLCTETVADEHSVCTALSHRILSNAALVYHCAILSSPPASSCSS